MSSTSADHLFPDPLSPFTDSALDFDIDVLQEITECLHQESPNPPVQYEDPAGLLLPSSSSSPPPVGGGADFPNFPVKTVQCQSAKSSAASLYKGGMQRSFSSISFKFDGVTSTSMQEEYSGSPVNPPAALNTLFSGAGPQMIRRVCSTGDLVEDDHSSNFRSGAPGRYTAEERRERIHRYRAKRNQRNFTKTIKYACRKTLADNRPRVRGRFARNDEPSSSSDQMIPKTTPFNRYHEEDDLWMDNLNDNQ